MGGCLKILFLQSLKVTFICIFADFVRTNEHSDEQISQLFGIKLGSSVVKLERLRGLKDGPMV